MKPRLSSTLILLAAAAIAACREKEPEIRDAATLLRVEREVTHRARNEKLRLQGKPAKYPFDLTLADYGTDKLIKALRREDIKRIYDPDSRVNVPEKPQPGQGLGDIAITESIARNLDGILMMVNKNDIPCSGSECVLVTRAYHDAQDLCACVAFRDEPVVRGENCSAFLVGPDVVATGAHCINEGNRADKRLFFGFRGTNGIFRNRYAENEIYSVTDIIARSDGTPDYAILRLDRPVCGRQPLRLDRAHHVSPRDKVYVIGHPAGLPLKLARDAMVLRQGTSDLFVANLDILGGNSGSPVLLEGSDAVIGILVDGAPGYVETQTCKMLSECPATSDDIPGCTGEGITPIARLPEFTSAVCR